MPPWQRNNQLTASCAAGEMPLIVKDYTWSETESEAVITVPLKGVKPSKADVLSTDRCVSCAGDHPS